MNAMINIVNIPAQLIQPLFFRYQNMLKTFLTENTRLWYFQGIS